MKISKKRSITAEDLLKLKFIRSVAISPDEKQIAYSLEWIDAEENKYYSNIWLVSAKGGKPRQFTHGKVKDGKPCWSSDGKRIAFISKRNEKQGIYIIPADGGESRKLVEMDGTFSSLSWSPNGKSLLCTFRKNDPTPKADKDKAEKKQPVVRHITRLFYKHDGEGFRPKDGFHLWIFASDTGKGKQITKGKYDERAPAFSPDGKRIAFVSNHSKDPDFDSLRDDLWIVSKDGDRIKKIPTPAGPIESPTWSPDGKRIAYLGHTNPNDAWGVTNYHVWVVPMNAKGKAKDLMPNFDRMAMDMTLSDMRAVHDASYPVWSADGKQIYFLGSDQGNAHLFLVKSSGGNPARLISRPMELINFDTSGSKDQFALLVSDQLNPGDIWLLNLSTKQSSKAKRLTDVNRELFANIELSQPEEIHYPSHDGTKIQAWIMKPIGFKRGKKYPAVVQVHGGPRAQYGNTFFHEFQLLAANGYVVFYANPRGSQGFGEAFADAITKDWGETDFKDVMAGVDYLETKDYVDSKRIGVMGGSYGGYMTNWLVGHTDRFKAAVTQRSVTNLISFFGSSDIGYDDWREFGGHPWDNFDEYVRMSPITYAKDMKTPLLIIHSENDLRCPIEQAEQLFIALKVLGRKVEFLRFPEETHDLSRNGRPDRRIERLKRTIDWFDRHLR